jgi:carboxylesterase
MKKNASYKSTIKAFIQKVGFWILGFVFAFILIFSFFLLKDIDTGELQTDPKPLTSYKEAERYIGGLKSLDDETVNEDCRTQFLSHGNTTERAVLIYHGYTSCPKQFENMGKLLFDRGYNVLIPRIPHHGLKDRLTDDIDNLNAKELVLFVNETVDIAQGLGTNVDVVGLSGGGILAGWALQNRTDVSRALVIAPNLGYAAAPETLALPVARFSSTIPNYFLWKDEDKQEYIEAPDYTYPRLSLRSLGHFFYIGSALLAQSEDTPIAAERVVIVSNENDTVVHTEMMDTLIDNWEQSTVTEVESYEFPAEHDLGHDIIDPSQPYANPDIVYPQLLQLLYGNTSL